MCAGCATGNSSQGPATSASSTFYHCHPVHCWWLGIAPATCSPVKSPQPPFRSRLFLYRHMKSLGLCLPVLKIPFQWVTLLHSSRGPVSSVHLSVHGVTNAALLPQSVNVLHSLAGIPSPSAHKSVFNACSPQPWDHHAKGQAEGAQQCQRGW